jgi:hypothetical protein
VETKVWFPDSPTREFVVGKHITAVVGIRNNGEDGFNVTAIQGNLALVTNPQGNVMNFTGTAYPYPELKKGEEIVVQYFMPLHQSLPTRQFYLHLQVFSQGTEESDLIVKSAFNSTIELIEEPTWLDMELLGLYVVFFGILALIAYGLHDYAVEKGWLSGSSKTNKKAGVQRQTRLPATAKHPNVAPSDWLKGTVADKQKKTKGKK